jgi:hypothetical protein
VRRPGGGARRRWGEEDARPQDAARRFIPLPKRWKVEQTFGVAAIRRRLRLDYESLFQCSAAMFMLASVFRLASVIACRLIDA